MSLLKQISLQCQTPMLEWGHRKKERKVRIMLDSLTIDHGIGKGITRVPVADTLVGTRWVECGWCRQEATGKIARKGSPLCSEHNRIRKETL